LLSFSQEKSDFIRIERGQPATHALPCFEPGIVAADERSVQPRDGYRMERVWSSFMADEAADKSS
jgi:hypothetical protein